MEDVWGLAQTYHCLNVHLNAYWLPHCVFLLRDDGQTEMEKNTRGREEHEVHCTRGCRGACISLVSGVRNALSEPRCWVPSPWPGRPHTRIHPKYAKYTKIQIIPQKSKERTKRVRHNTKEHP